MPFFLLLREILWQIFKYEAVNLGFGEATMLTQSLLNQIEQELLAEAFCLGVVGFSLDSLGNGFGYDKMILTPFYKSLL